MAHSIFFELKNQLKEQNNYIPRNYKTIGGMWTVETWQKDNLRLQIMDEGYTTVISFIQNDNVLWQAVESVKGFTYENISELEFQSFAENYIQSSHQMKQPNVNTPMQYFKNEFKSLKEILEKAHITEVNLNKSEAKTNQHYISFCGEHTPLTHEVKSDFIKIYSKAEANPFNLAFSFQYIDKEQEEWTIKVTQKEYLNNSSQPSFKESKEFTMVEFKELLKQFVEKALSKEIKPNSLDDFALEHFQLTSNVKAKKKRKL